jgi:hypothetical protein
MEALPAIGFVLISLSKIVIVDDPLAKKTNMHLWANSMA